MAAAYGELIESGYSRSPAMGPTSRPRGPGLPGTQCRLG